MIKRLLAVLILLGAVAFTAPTQAQNAWVCSYNFLTSNGGWTAQGAGTWSNGVGWIHTDTGSSRAIRIRKEFGVTTRINQIRITAAITRGNTNQGLFFIPSEALYFTDNFISTGTSTLLPDMMADSFQFEYIVSNNAYSGSVTVTRVDIGGNGTSLCVSPTATPTVTPGGPTLTPTPIKGGQCMYLLPCGPLPWAMPEFYPLESPTPVTRPRLVIPSTSTPVVTWVNTLTPALTATPTTTPTITPTGTVTPTLDFDDFSGQLGTLEAITASTPIVIEDVYGDDFSYDSNQIVADSEEFWAHVKAIAQIHFGVFTPIVYFIFFSLAYILLFQSSGFLLGIISAIIGVIRKIFSLILDFLPL